MKALALSAVSAASLALFAPAQAQDAQSRSDQTFTRYYDQSASEALPLTEALRETSNQALQDTLYELIYLRHATHQGHWNVQGPLFYSLHDLLGELYTGLDPYIDMVAERKRALGAPADGRPGAVADGAELPDTPAGLTSDVEVLRYLLDQYEPVAERLRDRIDATSEDMDTQDLLIGVSRQIEKDMWMIRSFQL